MDPDETAVIVLLLSSLQSQKEENLKYLQIFEAWKVVKGAILNVRHGVVGETTVQGEINDKTHSTQT